MKRNATRFTTGINLASTLAATELITGRAMAGFRGRLDIDKEEQLLLQVYGVDIQLNRIVTACKMVRSSLLDLLATNAELGGFAGMIDNQVPTVLSDAVERVIKLNERFEKESRTQ